MYVRPDGVSATCCPKPCISGTSARVEPSPNNSRCFSTPDASTPASSVKRRIALPAWRCGVASSTSPVRLVNCSTSSPPAEPSFLTASGTNGKTPAIAAFTRGSCSELDSAAASVMPAPIAGIAPKPIVPAAVRLGKVTSPPNTAPGKAVLSIS